MARAYAFLCSPDALELPKVLAMVDEAGKASLAAMKLLDHGACVRVWGAGWGVGVFGLRR